MKTPIRVLIVDDSIDVREGLQALLSEELDIEVVGQAANGDQAVQQAIRHRPDVILLDLVMPIMNGVEAVRCMCELGLPSRVIVLAGHADGPFVNDALQAGANGHLLKDVLKPDLLAAVRDGFGDGIGNGRRDGPYDGLHNGATTHLDGAQPEAQPIDPIPTEPPLHASLTGRERDVLRLITQGQSNKQIAMHLRLTEGTVKGYVSAILAKLHVADRTQAAVYALKHALAEG